MSNTEGDKVSRNAMFVLFAMVSLMAFTIATFVYMIQNVPAILTAEILPITTGIFGVLIGVYGTSIGNLIQSLWGNV